MDAFFSAPDVWAEQKLKEQRGEREVYMYNKPLIPERVLLSVVWGSIVLFGVGKIVWKGILHSFLVHYMNTVQRIFLKAKK